MNPFEKDVLLPTIHAANEALGAIHAAVIAERIGKSARTARFYLRRLEAFGVVARPYGERSGWVTVDFQLRIVQGSV